MSGLEPLAALGLVCNIVQLVEVGLKTATLCKNAYRTGEPDPELSVYAQNLADTASSLTQSLEVSQQPLNLDDSRLLTLARNCRDAEEEWRKKTPARFLSQQKPRKRARFGAVLQGIVNKPEIDRLESQLRIAKESLETNLLVGVFKGLDISKVQASDLQDKLQTLLQASSASEKELHDLIQRQVSLINTQISDRINRAEASTKTHVTTELASHESKLISHVDRGRDTILIQAEARENSRRENEGHERLLQSFYYPDMNHRRNNIHSSHQSTFNWIFEGGPKGNYGEPEASQSDSQSENSLHSYAQELVYKNFVRWLKSTEDRYWVSGRPGTGKSVLMKFIISHRKTMESLRQWQPDVQILTHFFWKVGSPMQNSFKGFLCSLAYQLCSLDKEHAMGWLQQNPDWSRKAGPGDWDNEDLQSLIASYLSLTARPFCLFIDGLDEFEDDDGVSILIGFLDSMQTSSRLVKVCMSSRLEQGIRMRLCRNPDMKMQNLTRNDIKCYSRAILNKEIALASSSIDVEVIVRDIGLMAEGVFLWAVLVTRSIARGIMNGDSESDIHERVSRTPKDLYKLYLDMWERLGEDVELYQESTALILSFIVMVWRSKSAFYPSLATASPYISIFELMVASSDDLWLTSVDSIDSLPVTDLQQRCKELCARVPVRSAGLLEVVEYTRDYERFGTNLETDPAIRYRTILVKAVHRTAIDFLVGTEDGKQILRSHMMSQEVLFIRLFRACLLRDCLWPAIQFTGNNRPSFMDKYQGRDASQRLDRHLKSLAYHRDILQGSALAEMIDLIWATHVHMIKNFPAHNHPEFHILVPRCKLDYLLFMAQNGFDAFVKNGLIEWRNRGRIDVLYRVFLVCLRFRHRWRNRGCDTRLEFGGRIRLMEHIIRSMAGADKFQFFDLGGMNISNNAVAKRATTLFLIHAINAFRLRQEPASRLRLRQHSWIPWEPDRIDRVIRVIGDFRNLLCFADSLVIAVHLCEPISGDLPLHIGYRHTYAFWAKALYVEITVSILAQIFLRQAVKYSKAHQYPEIKEDLRLGAFPQTIKPVMLSMRSKRFLISSGADKLSFERFCRTALLLDSSGSRKQDSNEAHRFQKIGEDLFDDAITRAVEIADSPKGDGPDGMTFNLCSTCETEENNVTRHSAR
jgi:hypothetical protein